MSEAKLKNPTRYWLGKHFPEEAKEKMSKAHLGKSTWSKGLTKEKDKRVAKRSELLKGHKTSSKTKQKISEALRGHIGYWEGKHRSKETNGKISRANKGRILSKEHKEKISKALRGKPNLKLKGKKCNPRSEETKRKIGLAQKGEKSYNYGKILSEGTKRKIGKAVSGSNNGNWKGGISCEPYSQDWTDDLREAIRKRDNYTCQLCGIYQDELKGYHKKLDVHHKDYNKDNLNPDNLISLCRDCHLKTNHNREYWMEYFLGKENSNAV